MTAVAIDPAVFPPMRAAPMDCGFGPDARSRGFASSCACPLIGGLSRQYEQKDRAARWPRAYATAKPVPRGAGRRTAAPDDSRCRIVVTFPRMGAPARTDE